MNYRENQQKAIANGIDVLSLEVANEVDFAIECHNAEDEESECEIKLTDEEFESLCWSVEEAYLKYESYSVSQCAKAAIDLIVDGHPIDEINRYMISDNIWCD